MKARLRWKDYKKILESIKNIPRVVQKSFELGPELVQKIWTKKSLKTVQKYLERLLN